MCQVIMGPFLGVIFHSVVFFALEVMRVMIFGHVKMCVIMFKLLLPIWENGTVSGEMGL